jgi:hypothetical protein
VRDVFGPRIQHLTALSEADDGFCLIRSTFPAGVVMPIHSHAYRETFYVLDGERTAIPPSKSGEATMRTGETFKEINHDRRRLFGGVASTLDLSASRRRAEGAACAAAEDGEDGVPVPPSDARAGAEGDRVVLGRVAMRDLLPDLRVVAGFFVVPPFVGLIAALTTLPNLYAFWPLFCLATIVSGFATLLLAVPTFLIQEQSGRTGWRIHLLNGALLGCIVSGAVGVPLFGQLLAHVLAGGPIGEIAEAISSVAAYCAFLGIVGAATFWLVARPDHARWRVAQGRASDMDLTPIRKSGNQAATRVSSTQHAGG